jgi:hypothetical protein
MKRILLVSLFVGLLAGQASAGFYTMDATTAAGLRFVSGSDGISASDALKYVGNKPGTALGDKVFGTNNFYGSTNPMAYEVGFVGTLTDQTGDGIVSVLIGAKSQAVLPNTGSYDGFYLPISNDNDDPWEYKLYVDTTGTDYESPSWTPLASGTQTTLTLLFGSTVNFNTLVDIGFEVQLNRGGIGDSDSYHTSVVPVPGAVLLGLLGIGVAGWRLRKFA